MATNTFSHSSKKTYILVHGAAHGAWCWKKLVPLLEAKGYEVIALDLPSRGGDTTQLENITLGDDAKKVADVANATEGKVALVGHSSGGVVISQSAELLGPEKIDKLIYLDAFLPQNGESVFSLAGKIRESYKVLSDSKSDGPEPELLIFSEDKKSGKWNTEHVEQFFYHDCLPEDISFAKAHLSWQSVSTIATPVHVTDNRYGIIKKYYILCTQAKDLDKSSIVSNVRCEKVYRLSSSHSPFFSMPEKLVDILVEIY
ncbi:alpha/beta fold hydrolase [Segetibacter koreensis]|uniref:alpha/beta fold hydrolase n=1 Tax=Segetibacter koreensis TaxID=398037 RepID=UPI00037E8872|nr:alpha/beta fold hydrolase [Segetibacter koreensis]